MNKQVDVGINYNEVFKYIVSQIGMPSQNLYELYSSLGGKLTAKTRRLIVDELDRIENNYKERLKLLDRFLLETSYIYVSRRLSQI